MGRKERFALTEIFLKFIQGVCYIMNTKKEAAVHKVADLRDKFLSLPSVLTRLHFAKWLA